MSEPSKGAGVLLFAENTGRMLLNRRSEDVSLGGTWALFGGRVDPEEGPEEGARRELREEASISLDTALHRLHVRQQSGFHYYSYAGFVADEIEPELNWESAEYEWVQLPDIHDLDGPLHPGLKDLLYERRTTIRRIYQSCFVPGGKPVDVLA